MKSPLARIAAVLFPLFAAAACGGDKSQQVDRDLASLIPADTVAVARIASIDELVQHARDVAKAAGEDTSEIDAGAMLGQLGGMGGKTELIDRKRSIAVAVTLPRGGKPAPVLLVPSTDANAYAASLPKLEVAPVVAGKYVAVPFGAKYEKPSSPSTAMDGLPGGAFAMRADVEKLTAAFGPMIAVGLKSFEAAMAQKLDSGAGASGEAIAALYAGAVRAVLEAAKALELSIDYRDGKLDALAKLTVKSGSDMDDWSSAPVDVSALGARMTGKSPVEAVLVMDMQKLWPHYEAIMDVVLDLYPPDARGAVRAMIASGKEMYGATGAAIATEGDIFGEDGISMAMHFTTNDAAKVQTWVDTVLANEGMSKAGFSITAAKPTEEKGATVRDFVVKVDAAKVAAMTGTDAQSGEISKQVIASTFGGGELSARLATRGTAATIAVGKQGAAAAALAALDRSNGSFSKPVQAALARVADCNPLLVERLDMAAIVAAMSRLMGGGGLAARSMAPPAGLTADVVVSGGIRGSEWRAGFSMDVAAVARLVKAMRPR